MTLILQLPVPITFVMERRYHPCTDLTVPEKCVLLSSTPEINILTAFLKVVVLRDG